MGEAWWNDVAAGAPSDVGVHVGPTEVRLEYAAIARGKRVAAAVGAGVVILGAVGLAMPGAFVGAALGGVVSGAAVWRWISRDVVVRLGESGLVVEDPYRGLASVSWEDVLDVVLQEAVPDSEGSDLGIPAAVRVERRRPPIGSADPLRLGAHLDDSGRAWLLAAITLFWRTSVGGPAHDSPEQT